MQRKCNHKPTELSQLILARCLHFTQSNSLSLFWHCLLHEKKKFSRKKCHFKVRAYSYKNLIEYTDWRETIFITPLRISGVWQKRSETAAASSHWIIRTFHIHFDSFPQFRQRSLYQQRNSWWKNMILKCACVHFY